MSQLSGQNLAPTKDDALIMFKKNSDDTSGIIIDILSSEEISDHYVSLFVEYVDLIDDHVDTSSSFARGAALFILFHDLVSEGDPSLNGKINIIVRSTAFKEFFQWFYGFDEDIGIRKLEFSAAGTTSFIFTAVTVKYQTCALKVIQAPYVRIPSISAATERYQYDYGMHTRYSPKIFCSGRSWIFMQFIDGYNLYDYMNLIRNKYVFMSPDYIKAISSILSLLLAALSYYERLTPSIVHGDLTPFNIMVSSNGDLVPEDIYLIDFGPNYVLQDRIVNRRVFVSAFSRTELFTAPEVARERQIPSVDADLYSLGMIALDLLCSEPLQKDIIGVRLREIWSRTASVGIAQIIEELIDENPQHRMTLIRRVPGSIYTNLRAIVDEQVKTYTDIASEQTENHLIRAVKRAIKADVWSVTSNIRKVAKNNNNAYNVMSNFEFRAALVNSWFQTIILVAFAVYTLIDCEIMNHIDLEIPIPFGKYILNWILELPSDFKPGDFWGNLPGRSVALTFGLIATRYYANIYAALTVRDLDTFEAKVANFVLRFNSVSYFIPIMVAIVYNPKWWPFCSLVGTMFPAINNYLCWRISLFAKQKADSLFSIEKFHRQETSVFVSYYKEWWVLMGSYGLVIGVIGIFLNIGWARDEWIYAGIVVTMNMLKIYRNNCGLEAPHTYGNLSRMFFVIRRWAAVQRAIAV